MKKVLLFIMLLVMPIIRVNANSGPEPASYKVVVTNPNGAILYNSSLQQLKIIPYNTHLTISSELINNDIWYGSVSKAEEENLFGYINLDDVATYNYELSDAVIEDGEVYTLTEKSIYQGPSFKYPKLNVKIPKNTSLKYNYIAGQVWAYITYNGASGWIDLNYKPFTNDGDDITFEDTVIFAAKKTNRFIILNDTISLHDEPKSESSYEEIKVEPKTMLTPLYYNSNHYLLREWVYVEFDGNAGWIEIKYLDNLIVNKEEGTIIPIKSRLKLYDGSYITVKPYELIQYKYRGDFTGEAMAYYMINYNNKDYLIINEDIAEMYSAIFNVNSEVLLKDEASLSSNTLTTIPSDTEILSTYNFLNYYTSDSGWIYTSYNGIKGWVQNNRDIYYIKMLDNEELQKEDEEVLNNNDNNKDNIENYDNLIKEGNELFKKNNKVNKWLTPNFIIAYCTFGVVALVFIALLILLKLNKK